MMIQEALIGLAISFAVLILISILCFLFIDSSPPNGEDDDGTKYKAAQKSPTELV